MKNSKQFSQRLFVRAPGLRRQTSRAFVRFLWAFVAFTFIFSMSAQGALAADSNSMALLPVSNNMELFPNSSIVDKDRFMRGSHGFLVEELDGRVIEEQNPDTAYNPASAVKVLTAYATLKHFGPDFEFETKVLIDGSTVGNLFEGDIYLQGRDPFFNTASLQQVFAAFKSQGVNTVEASLFVSSDFGFAGSARGQKAASALKRLFGGAKQKRARTLRTAGVRVNLKNAQVKAAPAQATVLTQVKSPNILALLKDMLSRSDNQMAETFGQEVGGPQAVARICRADFSLSSDALTIATTSGLGVNRVSPKAMIAALRGFKKLLAGYKLNLSDALPIAGIDQGTIYKRFAQSELKDVLVGKTGTLKQTDKGASVLVGEISTLLRGHVLFVVFQRGRNTYQLRQSQNLFLEHLLSDSGGPGLKYSG